MAHQPIIQPNGYHQLQRRKTFDASTEFEDYTNLLDDDTKELLQNEAQHNAVKTIADLKQNGMYQPPLVNDYEKAQILENAAKFHANKGAQSILIDVGNSHFKQWQQSRRRTLDELESKGVIDPNFFNLNDNNPSAQSQSYSNNKAHYQHCEEGYDLPPIPTPITSMIPSISASSSSILNEDDNDIELYKNDLFYIHSHQIIHKWQANMFSQLLKDNTHYNQNNPIHPPHPPPPTAAHTPAPFKKGGHGVGADGGFTDIDAITNKLERHSKEMRESETPHYPSQKSIMSLMDNGNGLEQKDIDSKFQSIWQNNNVFNINYNNIASYIDGGILSSSIFLPYKEWIDASIVRFTKEANQCLDEMKVESNLLESLHRSTIHGGNANPLYDDAEVGGGDAVAMDVGKEQHLRKLSEIDSNLADIRDEMRRMFRVQQHIQFIQQQYDTHINKLRGDQSDLLSIYFELIDRDLECGAILNALCLGEVWLITNIANIIADRSENIDSINRKIKECVDLREKANYLLQVEAIKLFIDELTLLIKELSLVSDNKRSEIRRLKMNIDAINKQNSSLIKSSLLSYNKINNRLWELQTHYKLPGLPTITASLHRYLCDSLDCNNYYNKSLQLYHSNLIYSIAETKVFYSQFVLLINNIIIDCMVMDEYVSSNNENHNNDNNGNKEKKNRYDSRSQHCCQESTDQILNEVFTPIGLEPSMRSVSFGALHGGDAAPTLLDNILNNNECNMSFECVDLVKNVKSEHSLLKKIKIMAVFGHIVPFRETVCMNVAQFITVQYREQIATIKFDKMKIKKLATEYCLVLVSCILSTYKKKNGLIKAIKKLMKKNKKQFEKQNENNEKKKKFKDINVYKIAALILHNVYNITMPFPM